MLHDGRWKNFRLRLDGAHRDDLIQLPFDRLYLSLDPVQPSLKPLWTQAEGLDHGKYHAQDEDPDPEDNESHGERSALLGLNESPSQTQRRLSRRARACWRFDVPTRPLGANRSPHPSSLTPSNATPGAHRKESDAAKRGSAGTVGRRVALSQEAASAHGTHGTGAKSLVEGLCKARRLRENLP